MLRHFFAWLFRPFRLRTFFLVSLAAATAGLLVWSGYDPLWPVLLAAECAAVGLGISFGWCIVKFDRTRLKWVKPDSELDKLGFFNSRIAMRSQELFDITIADLSDVTPEQKESARELVRNYWKPKTDHSAPMSPEPKG
jgi:hypothetical protein